MPRKHITTACTACRESKTRCDGAHPQCSNCKAKAKECLYQQGADKRKLSVRKTIEVFSRRVSQLEDFICAHGLEVPPTGYDDAIMIGKMLDTISSPGERESSDEPRVSDGDLATSLAADMELRSHLSSSIHLAGLVAPEEPLAAVPDSRRIGQSTCGLSPASESTTDNSFEVQGSGSNALPVASESTVHLDGLTSFQMDSVEFPDWTTALTDPSTLPLEPIAFGWDQLRQPYPAYPSMDFAIPPPPLSDEIWLDIPPPSLSEEISRLQRWPQTGHEATELTGDESGDEDEDDVVNQISDRMGSLHLSEDGELRYYGATSNLTLLDDASPLEHRCDIEDGKVRKRGQTMLEAAGLGQPVSPTLQQHLCNLYFTWQDPSVHVVDKEMFERERDRYHRGDDDSTFYSETLMNAICAFGALYDPQRQDDLPTPLSNFFVARAKTWLEVELDSPRVATVQALVILSSYEAAQTRDARGWLYSGMSMRLSFDLGLHIDMTPYVTSGRMSAEEAEVRKVAIWGSFIVDQLWGFYLGRPPFHINTDEVSVQRPAERLNASKQGEWTPYGLVKAVSVRAQVNPTELLTRQWVLLCEIMGSYCHVLYDRHDVDVPSLRSIVQKTVAKLEAWKTNLPPDLQVHLDQNSYPGSKPLPHVLVLHMKYYQSMIFIHRPFVSRQGSRSFPPSVDLSYNHARKVCIESAVGVSSLLRIYRNAYTLRYTNVEVVSVIFSAAIMLVFASVAIPPQQDAALVSTTVNGRAVNPTGQPVRQAGPTYAGHNISAHLDTCCKALADLGRVFQNATRTLEVLLAIKRKWQAELLASTGSKRRGSNMSRTATESKKRTLCYPQGNTTKAAVG